jgi:ATP adenylyltransferase
MTLLDLMIDHLRRLSLSSSSSNEEEEEEEEEEGGQGRATRGMKTMMKLSDLSYNLIMTEGYLHLVPRSRESYYYHDNVVV